MRSFLEVYENLPFVSLCLWTLYVRYMRAQRMCVLTQRQFFLFKLSSFLPCNPSVSTLKRVADFFF